jgi:hypothetical protein
MIGTIVRACGITFLVMGAKTLPPRNENPGVPPQDKRVYTHPVQAHMVPLLRDRCRTVDALIFPQGPEVLMPERLKLRHKVTREEKGPYLGWYPADWFPLFTTNEYDFIRSSDCYDKNGAEIFEGDMVSYIDGWPVQIVDNIGRVGYYEGRAFIEVTPEWSAFAEVVGRDGVLSDW